MPDNTMGSNGHGVGALESPSRNRYFYGKLLDQLHLSMEQHYFNDKRWLLNRLSLGRGVLCGLVVAPSRDRKRIVVGPGVAVDGAGREIIVPTESPPIDPRQPTDECCAPTGDSIKGASVVTICLAYLECETEPVPVLVCGCESENGCEHGTVRERYCVRVTEGAPRRPGGIDPRACAVFVGPQSPARETISTHLVEIATPTLRPAGLTGTTAMLAVAKRIPSRRERLCNVLTGNCADAIVDCVTLASVELKEDGTIGAIDNCGPRVTLYSNQVLLDLILCLADRLDQCCDKPPVSTKRLEKVSGDGQSGQTGRPLRTPAIVRVVDASGVVPGELVTFAVSAGGGSLAGTNPVATAPDGTAKSPIWTLGNNAGVNTLHASINSGSPASVDFTATGKARQVPPAAPPKILRLWPQPSEELNRPPVSPSAAPASVVEEWANQPWLELSFDRQMDANDLNNPSSWLRVAVLRVSSTPGISTHAVAQTAFAFPIPIAHKVLQGAPQLNGPGITERFELQIPIDTAGNRLPLTGSRIIVLVRATGSNITEAPPASGTALLLDADYSAVALTNGTAAFNKFWNLLAPTPGPITSADTLTLAQDLTSTLTPIPAAGTGNDTGGGDFFSFFVVLKL